MTDRAVKLPGGNALTCTKAHIEAFENLARNRAIGFRPTQRHHVSVGHGLNSEPVFKHGKVGVELAEKLCSQAVVLEGDC